jgi:hypothetical protein
VDGRGREKSFSAKVLHIKKVYSLTSNSVKVNWTISERKFHNIGRVGVEKESATKRSVKQHFV